MEDSEWPVSLQAVASWDERAKIAGKMVSALAYPRRQFSPHSEDVKPMKKSTSRSSVKQLYQGGAGKAIITRQSRLRGYSG